MNVAKDEEMEEEKLRETAYPRFRVLTGGKGPPEPPSTNWLSEFEVGTTFVAKRNNSKDCDLELFHVIFKRPDVMLLKWELADGKMLDKYVEPEVFSKMFKRGIILGVINIEATEVDGEDGNSNRTDRPRDVVLDAPVSRKHKPPQTIGSEEPDLRGGDQG